MSEFPVDPQLKTLLVSPKYQYSNEMFSIVALLSVPPIFQRPSDKKHQVECAHEQCAHVEGDHLTLLNTYHDYRQNKSTVSVSFYQCSVNEIAPSPPQASFIQKQQALSRLLARTCTKFGVFESLVVYIL